MQVAATGLRPLRTFPGEENNLEEKGKQLLFYCFFKFPLSVSLKISKTPKPYYPLICMNHINKAVF